ncbi:MAG: hypothetical protein DI535_00670 [Citrobacter freundii]|nr:MAG: hypothetical protein DI535_00670 [Citrobacter freundii]
MSYSEHISQSFDTLLKLIQIESELQPTNPEGIILREKKLHFLVDDLLTKAGHLAKVEKTKDHTVPAQPLANYPTIQPSSNAIKAQSFLNEYRQEVQTSFTNMQVQKASLDIEIGRRMKNKKIKYLILVCAWVFCVLYAFDKLGWDKFEKWTWFVPFLISMALPYAYIIITERELSLIKFIEEKRKFVTNQVYTMFNFDDARFEELQVSLNKLKIDQID